MASNDQRAALAQKNGKPRDANRIAGRTAAQDVRDNQQNASANASDGSKVEREGDRIYRYVPKFDHTIIEGPDGSTSAPVRGNQLPSNSMNGYIDKVLEMSGMTTPATGPTPQSRPDMSEDDMSGAPIGAGMTGTSENPGKAKDDVIAAPKDASGDWSMGDLLLGALGIGGAGTAAKAIYNAYMNRGTANAAEPNAAAAAPTNAADDITSIADTTEQKQIAGPQQMQQIETQKQGRLPPPPLQIEGPQAALTQNAMQPNPATPVDEMIANTLGEDDIDQIFRDRVEGTEPRPATESRFAPRTEQRVDPKIANEAQRRANAGDIRGAVTMLRENGIELDDNMIRALAEQSNTIKTLRQRAGSITANAARRAAQ